MHKAAKHVRAGQSATTQASRQSWQEPARRRASAARCVLKSTKFIEICRGKINLRPQAAGEDA